MPSLFSDTPNPSSRNTHNVTYESCGSHSNSITNMQQQISKFDRFPRNARSLRKRIVSNSRMKPKQAPVTVRQQTLLKRAKSLPNASKLPESSGKELFWFLPRGSKKPPSFQKKTPDLGDEEEDETWRISDDECDTGVEDENELLGLGLLDPRSESSCSSKD